MHMKLLLVVSGPDRVGKSTFIHELVHCEGFNPENFFIKHHSRPADTYQNVYDSHADSVTEWKQSGKPFAIFDRSWPCTYILERLREHNTGHFEDLIDFEIQYSRDLEYTAFHLGILKPWHWSAPHHLKELTQLYGSGNNRLIRDNYIARMQEHEHYSRELIKFYNTITMFPHRLLQDENYDVKQVWTEILTRAESH
jgi:hypothetical protein